MLRDHINEMIEMYAQGHSLEDIAQNFGVSRQRIHQLIGDSYDRPHHGRLRRERYEDALRAAHQRILEGISSFDEEAKRMGIKTHSLRVAFAAHELRLPPRPPSPEHGTYYRYQRGCRCDECSAARKDYTLTMRERGPREHGTVSAYRNYACRCDECRAAASIANRLDRLRYKQRKRQVVPLD